MLQYCLRFEDIGRVYQVVVFGIDINIVDHGIISQICQSKLDSLASVT